MFKPLALTLALAQASRSCFKRCFKLFAGPYFATVKWQTHGQMGAP